jgi:succinoglycan biosynthesis protein ExoA
MHDDAAAAGARAAAEIDCSILVPVLDEERYIERSLAAMRRQRFAGTLEFLFADGGSSDRTRELLEAGAREDPRVRIFDNRRRSVTSGLNVALRNARGRWVARMDAHSEYPEDYVSLGVARLERGDTRWVSGPQIPAGDNAVSRAVALALSDALGRGASRKWGREGDAALGEEFEVDSGVFAGVWERATLLEYGGWDERWVVNEDGELAGRFLERGERLVCLPAMGARYAPRRSLAGLWRQYHTYGTYRERTSTRHPRTLRRSLLLPPALVIDVTLALAGPGRARRPARAGVALYTAALGRASLRARRERAGVDALLMPAVLAVMHLGHGSGFLRGALRFGPPLAALASVAGLDGLAASLAPAPEPVFNPSLTDP